VTDENDTRARPLDGLRFDHRFTRDLPGDTEAGTRRRQVEGAAFSRIAPTPVAAPRTIIWSAEVAELLGLSAEQCDSDDFAQVFGGNRLPAGADPFAMCYGGHQFGNWAGQLGDGRAIALGEVLDVNGGHQTLQLKGPGPTPYSRTADGRAVLRSSVREFLCSEAMFHLGVPTTRALSLVLTGDGVVRDMLYNGNPAVEPGAIVCRVAPSFVRFGSFQLPRSRHDLDLLRHLTEFTITNDFPDIAAASGSFSDHVVALFDEVCQRSLKLVIDWMRVGFVHGVLNTDNMSILGLTIDYGPYGWLEDFDAGWTPNTTDASGKRYRYGAQPTIFGWNLAQLANALAPLVDDIAPLQASLDQFVAQYFTDYLAMMVDRLGWNEVAAGDDELVQEFLGLLGRIETDYVIMCRSLAMVPTSPEATDDELLAPLTDAWYLPESLVDDVRTSWLGWLRAWGKRAVDGGLSETDRQARMNSMNPTYVLRNYLAQEAIDAAEQGDETLIHQLLEVLRHPYDDQPGQERFAARRPEWARHRVGCSMLSCSS
jgi:serine/tyrosine/threonine adenylyltransferase